MGSQMNVGAELILSPGLYVSWNAVSTSAGSRTPGLRAYLAHELKVGIFFAKLSGY